MAELREVTTILESGKVEEDHLHTALQALLFYQCLYEDWPHGRAYRIVTRHLAQIQPIMSALGFKLTYHVAMRMVVLETQSNTYAVNLTRLKKDETIVLLIIRLLYAEGISLLDEQARIEVTTDDVHDRLRSCGEEPPQMQRLLEILKMLQHKGLVRVGEKDPVDQVAILTIMPGITVLVPDVYVEAIILWLEQKTTANASLPPLGKEASLLGHIASYRAALGTAPENPPSSESVEAFEEADDVQA